MKDANPATIRPTHSERPGLAEKPCAFKFLQDFDELLRSIGLQRCRGRDWPATEWRLP